MKESNANAATLRCLRIVEMMAGRVLDGLSNKDLADALRCPPPTVSRDLDTLMRAGWVQRLETGRWSLTPRPLQVAQAYSNHVTRTTTRIAELNQRIVSGALAMGGTGAA
ncbi:helix-turn-helix domain-containing protein [Desulfovibrio psychrotolerans]|uniref:IclR family transcriptional regulator n=1 Tax=Desulfovibrio psychrotolerans TaxID=415242 RepID=A0A7J0BVG2_9BACT|nr:helix-turn-helix domain-containing protein [Desulfovibrio psychrotolerans]GFM37707.1 IclR family transcriptional regulator [Desulfovibrio psychrotolerans]